MLLIRKGREPRSLTNHRAKPHASYDNLPETVKDAIREALLSEQEHLCAYCMRQIFNARDGAGRLKMKIEHWTPENLLNDRERLDYGNMLGVCTGHMDGLDGKTDTCDASKGGNPITVDPRRPDHIQTLSYRTATGEIRSDNPQIQRDLEEALNLNCKEQFLPQNRRDAYLAVKSVLDRKGWNSGNLNQVLREYTSPDAEGKLRPYAGIIVWYINKCLLKKG